MHTRQMASVTPLIPGPGLSPTPDLPPLAALSSPPPTIICNCRFRVSGFDEVRNHRVFAIHQHGPAEGPKWHESVFSNKGTILVAVLLLGSYIWITLLA